VSSEQTNMTEISKKAVASWQAHLQQAQQDGAWLEAMTELERQREEAVPQIRELLDGFLAGNTELERFRSEFDRRSRTEWSTFGFGGFGGGMVLNKLVKHVPDHATLTAKLKVALRAPADEAGAARQIREFLDYLAALETTNVTTALKVDISRVPFFVPFWWHVQSPEEWPIYYKSTRDALVATGVLGESAELADQYTQFRRVFREFKKALGLNTWRLEQLCKRVAGGDSEGAHEEIVVAAPATTEGGAERRVWLLAPGEGARLWEDFKKNTIAAIGWDHLGNLKRYADFDAIRKKLTEGRDDGKTPMNDALACYEFAHRMQVGDVIFAKRGVHHIVGYGVVESDYRFDPKRSEYKHVRTVKWLKSGEWRVRDKSLVLKTLTDIGKYPQLVAQLENMLGIRNGNGPEIPGPTKSYTLDDACRDIFLGRARVERMLGLLRHKKNLILQGPPGVGKTFVAKRLAYLLLGEKAPERVEMVQFHQSYSYEDFVRGYCPTEEGGFVRRDGPFLRICNRALQDLDNAYVLIVDEINRGNLSKILGDLMMLIEADKRGADWATTLSYSTEDEKPFYVPPNLHIIGTMNTADRSLALVDYALRRRFAFISIEPGFETDAFAAELARMQVPEALVGRIRRRVKQLNDKIRDDRQLGPGFCVGHSYFCQVPAGRVPAEDWYAQIVDTEIKPLLEEYWFDDPERAADALALMHDDER
jgi:MoxR-like ATPase